MKQQYKIINEFEAHIIKGDKVFVLHDDNGDVAQLLQWFLSDTKLNKAEYNAAMSHNLEETQICHLKTA